MEQVSLKPRRERSGLPLKPVRRESLRTFLFGLAVVLDALMSISESPIPATRRIRSNESRLR